MLKISSKFAFSYPWSCILFFLEFPNKKENRCTIFILFLKSYAVMYFSLTYCCTCNVNTAPVYILFVRKAINVKISWVGYSGQSLISEEKKQPYHPISLTAFILVWYEINITLVNIYVFRTECMWIDKLLIDWKKLYSSYNLLPGIVTLFLQQLQYKTFYFKWFSNFTDQSFWVITIDNSPRPARKKKRKPTILEHILMVGATMTFSLTYLVISSVLSHIQSF